MKNRKNHPSLIVALAFLISLASCASPQKLVESGRYGEAINTSVKRLAGKKNKKTKHVIALEEAFNEMIARDMKRADRLKRENRPENWVEINEIYRNIRQKQEMVAPLLPLISKEGIKASVRFVKVDQLEYESREKAADYHYKKALAYLKDARKGDKRDARRAYEELDHINTYFTNYKDKTALKKEAHQLGITHVLVRLSNSSNSIIPHALDRDIRRMGVRDMDSFWRKHYTEQSNKVQFDYEVVMNITDLEVGPNLVKEREFEETKVIQDGTKYLLDANGNVQKDSLGNDIKIPRKISVRALVIETFQQKVAHINGHLEFYDLKTGNRIDTKPLAADALFEHYASTFKGDKRALSEATRRRIGNQPRPFPSDEGLLLTAVEELKPIIKNKIESTRKLI